MSRQIHPTAIIEEGAVLGDHVIVEAYAVIKSTVTLHDHVTVKSFVYIDGYTTIGEGTTIYPSTSIGTKTQDRKYQGERTEVLIGKNCEIREFVTINSSCGEGTTVSVGDNCLIMAYCHVAHNCQLGNNVIMSNAATLAGHVIVEDHAIIGGMTPVHQFSRIGRNAMVGGLSRVTNDVPPFTIGGGIPYKMGGLNIVGLKRHHFSFETRRELTRAYKLIYRSNLSFEEALDRCETELERFPEVEHFIRFCRESERGLIGLQGILKTPVEEKEPATIS
ncbi:MAG: acyl-ACP--UDP-N-acetylglucosamine O-acyltransferase [Chlamydiales bacterium]|nr:acyl-ACP--UDP-N-acetylglucosamine O-acyltransferase [Chlamydiia bacterium]MCP5506909.1 acyl-ACP--UDP-N-acetylglucosamine O-acyltransferase [Chlamydiales bacterium]